MPNPQKMQACYDILFNKFSRCLPFPNIVSAHSSGRIRLPRNDGRCFPETLSNLFIHKSFEVLPNIILIFTCFPTNIL